MTASNGIIYSIIYHTYVHSIALDRALASLTGFMIFIYHEKGRNEITELPAVSSNKAQPLNYS
jgi:hypothetical protein